MKMNKKSLTIKVKEETIEKIRRIVYWSPGLTLRDFCELALEREIQKWEDLNKVREIESGSIKLRPGQKIHL